MSETTAKPLLVELAETVGVFEMIECWNNVHLVKRTPFTPCGQCAPCRFLAELSQWPAPAHEAYEDAKAQANEQYARANLLAKEAMNLVEEAEREVARAEEEGHTLVHMKRAIERVRRCL